MRPLKLEMSAFGPFADVVTIDFRKLGSSGLYLVTGDTGAGKTTIFDAISYALYGAPSGELREGRMFRSKYANSNVETFVKLTFEVHGKEYVVKRMPEQTRAKKRGTGEMKDSEKVQLTFPDARLTLEKINDANDAIKEIVGLDQAQFSQITMLAQGEFRKLLTSETKMKEQIFREIFATEEYQILQRKLKDKSLEMQKEYERQEGRILSNIASLEYTEEFAGKEELELFKEHNQLVGKAQMKKLMEALIREDEQLIAVCGERLNEMEASLQQLNAKVGVAAERQKSVLQLQQTEKELEKLQASLEQRENALKVAEKNMEKVEALNAEAVRIETKLEDYDQYTTLKQDVEKKQQEVSALIKQQEKRKATMEKLEQDENHLNAVIEQNKDADVKLLECQQNFAELQERKEAVALLIKDYEEEHKLRVACEKKEKIYQKLSDTFERLSRTFVEHDKMFLDAQAGVLAAQLEEGAPCPVCGSLEHPHPAVQVETVVTREELDEERAGVDEARQQCQQMITELTKVREQWTQHRNQCTNQLKKLFGVETMESDELDARREQIKTQVAEVETQIQKWKEAKEQRNQAVEQLPHVQNSGKEMNAEFQFVQQEKVMRQTEIAQLLEQMKKLRAGLQFDSAVDAKKKVEVLRREVNAIAQEQKDAIVALQELKQDISKQEGQKKSIEKLLKDHPAEDLSVLEEQRDKLLKTKQQKDEEKGRIFARYQKNIDIEKNVNSQWDRFEEYEEHYLAVKRVSDTVNGELAGKDKVKLETYILMAYFERVLQKANVRLLGMTGGQYELVRCQQADNQKSQSGLDINVYDHYTASERSVKSLSGGETFMASLSLALGLADEIQSTVGGVHMDTLFVDEGFGSLDDDTLKRAMKELNQLTEGNRLVGIISHVADLKNWIDRQIVVTKVAHEGSRVEMVV